MTNPVSCSVYNLPIWLDQSLCVRSAVLMLLVTVQLLICPCRGPVIGGNIKFDSRALACGPFADQFGS